MNINHGIIQQKAWSSSKAEALRKHRQENTAKINATEMQSRKYQLGPPTEHIH